MKNLFLLVFFIAEIALFVIGLNEAFDGNYLESIYFLILSLTIMIALDQSRNEEKQSKMQKDLNEIKSILKDLEK